MTNTAEFEREIRTLLSEQEGERAKVNRRVELAVKAKEEIERKVNSLREALALYREHYGLSQPEIEIDEALRQEFENLTTKEALIQIAESNEGIVEGAVASETLIRAGMFGNKNNASSAVYAALKRHSSTFRKIARGKYQLLIRHVSQTATISIESEGPFGRQFKPSVAAPSGNDEDAWELEDDKAQVAG